MSDTKLGMHNEPRGIGAVVAVNYGDYRTQEIWISSGSFIGNWWCLGGEWGRPKVWMDQRTEMDKLLGRRELQSRPGPGEIPEYPRWEDVLRRGPVTLLVPGNQATYREGWKAGRRRMVEEMETISDDEPEKQR